MVSLAAPHFINGKIKEAGVLSINVVDESWLAQADYCGSVSGARQSKAEVFSWTPGEAGRAHRRLRQAHHGVPRGGHLRVRQL